MFIRSIRVGRVAGIPILVDLSWLAVFLLVAVVLMLGQFAPQHPQLPRLLLFALGLSTSLLFFVSVVLHELAHSLTARAFGIRVRNITLFLLGGVSQIESEASRAWQEFAIAIAGPLCSLALSVAFGVAWLRYPDGASPIATMLEALCGVNLAMAVFNMVPGFPLDGGRIFRSAVWGVTGDFSRSARIAALVGRGVAFGLMSGGLLIALSFERRFLANGVWLAVIGLFIDRAAARTYRYEVLRQTLQGATVRQIMGQAAAQVATSVTLRGLMERGHAGAAAPPLLAVDDGEQTPRGVVAPEQVRRAPRDRWDSLTVAEVMTPLERAPRLSPDAEALSALEGLDGAGADAAVVVEGERIVGLIGRDDIRRFGEQDRRQSDQEAA